jgi:hypothetical protein
MNIKIKVMFDGILIPLCTLPNWNTPFHYVFLHVQHLFRLFQLWLFKPNPFSLDVKFNDDATRIIASRLLIQAVNISDTNGEKEMVRALRNICHQSPLNVSVFHPYFVFFDQVSELHEYSYYIRGLVYSTRLKN